MRSSPRPSARRALGAMILAAAVALSAAGCATTPDETGPVTLKFWGWLNGLDQAVELFNSTHDDIQVEFQQIASADLDKLAGAIDNGTAPDVVQVGSHQLADYVVNQRIADISEYVDDVEDQFTPSSWATVKVGGGEAVYGVPQDSAPYGFMYRTDIFEQYGIAVPETWDDWLAAARKLHTANPDIYLSQFSPGDPAFWMSTVLQNGGSYFGIDGDAWTIQVDNEQSLEVADLWQTMLDEDLVKVVEMWTPEYWAEVNAGTIASISFGAWFPSVLAGSAPDLAGKWAVAPSPTFAGSDSVPDSGGSVNSVPISSEHPAEASEFITWLNTDPDALKILIDEGGIFPSSLSGLDMPELTQANDFFGGQKVGEIFVDEAPNVPNTWVDGPGHELVQSAIKDEFARVATGEITFQEALANAADKARQSLIDLGLTVK